jgi:hypothetical protein
MVVGLRTTTRSSPDLESLWSLKYIHLPPLRWLPAILGDPDESRRVCESTRVVQQAMTYVFSCRINKGSTSK